MDGDGQHDPEAIAGLLKYMPAYDMVVGERSKKDQASFGRSLGNAICNRLATYVAKFSIRDLTSGFRAVKREVALKTVYLIPNAYSYPTTLTLSVLRTGRSLKYVRVDVRNRERGKSNIRLFSDGVRFLMMIIKICTLYSPLRIFLPISFFTFVLGLSYYGYTFFNWGRFTNMSALLFTTSVLIFMLGLISDQICHMRFEGTERDL